MQHITTGTRFEFHVPAEKRPARGIATATEEPSANGWFSATDEAGAEWFLNVEHVVGILPATELPAPAPIGAQHFSPWGTSESFICGANAVGRRNSGLDLDRSKTTCRECLEQLDRLDREAFDLIP